MGLPTPRAGNEDEFATGEAVAQMAAAAESAGFHAVFVTEHPFPDDEWLASGGHHALDPMVALAFAAAATTTLRLMTNLFIPAYRNPFLSAKAVASLDALSGGRVVLGVGTGYLEPEYEALGVPFEERNDLTDEAIVAMKQAWASDGVVFDGRHFQARGHTMLPRPVQQPHPPIWVGGNSKRAIRRAVELGDGWIPLVNPAKAVERRRTPAMETLDDLASRIAYAREHAAAVGREAPLGIMFALGGLRFEGGLVELAGALAELGVTELYTAARPVDTRAEWLAQVERMGAEVLPHVAPL